MILRRPYAFLIKNFKVIHLLFVLLAGHLIYFSYILHSFFAEAKDVKTVTGRELTDILFSPFMYIEIFIILILSVTIILLMTFKKKKTLLYYANIFFYIALGVLYYYSYVEIGIMEITTVDIRIIRILYDLFGITLALQLVSIISFTFRATGFDIKKFNFGQDIVDLKIDVEDKEEFEVNFDFDINRINKKLHKKARFWKYTYIENRFLINLALCFVIALGALFYGLYLDSQRLFKQNTLIQTTNYIMKITKSYTTSKDYQSNTIIDNKTFVIVKMNIQSKFESKQRLRLGMFELKVGDKLYHPTYDYAEKFVDLGISYYDQDISNEASDYILAFPVDSNASLKNVSLSFYDGVDYGKSGNNNRIYKIQLDLMSLDNVINIGTYSIGQEMVVNNDFITNGKLILNNYEINNTFKLNYQFCITTNECYNSVEYLVPKSNSNIDKVLFKVKGSWGMDNQIEGLYNLYDFLRMYGSLSYTIGDKVFTARFNEGRVISLKVKENNVFYLEIPAKIMNSSNIFLNIGIRNNNYTYNLSK